MNRAAEITRTVIALAVAAGIVSTAFIMARTVPAAQTAAYLRPAVTAARHLRPCPTEDSSRCYWDARRMGNGRGHSFTAP